MSKTSPNSDRDAQKSTSSGVSRRSVLKATGAGIAGAGLTYATGSAQAAGINTPPLHRDGNLLVDPQGEQVTLRGVSIADPGEQARCWRGMNSELVTEMATSHEDWNNTMIRVPMMASFIYTGDVGVASQPPCDDYGKTPGPGAMPHGDDWGPAMPGTYGETELENYLAGYIDPLVELCNEVGAYIQLDYHRHYPVFHHEEHTDYVNNNFSDNRDGVNVSEVWECPGEPDETAPHTVHGNDDFAVRPDAGMNVGTCGERGILWHGEDQKDRLNELVSQQEPWNNFEAADGYTFESEDDVYLEPNALCNALDGEMEQFWSVVAGRYADDDNVVFDIYNEPTGPYAGDWGGPERPAGSLSLSPETADEAFEAWGEYAKPYYDLWRDRSQPWVSTAEDNGGGQVMTIGNPRWSQYVYWAPYNEHDAENMAYTSHVYLQDNCRPLETYQGQPSEHVPVFFSEFGWMDFDLTVPTPWMTRTDVAPGIEWANGDSVPDASEIDVEGYSGSGQSYGKFIEEHDVHPVCWAFDHTYEPNFYEHGTPGGTDGAKGQDSNHWHDDDYLIEEETPGGWWMDKLEEYSSMEDFNPNSGTEYYDGDADTTELHVGSGNEPETGYAVSSGDCGDVPEERIETVDGQTVCDVNDDGFYRDVTGDGNVGQGDVAEFFNSQHRSEWKQTDMFDFSENGAVTHGDVVELFDYVGVS